MKKTINPEVLQELEEADWNDLLPRLLKYARYKSLKLLQFGHIVADPEELVEKAIGLAYGVGEDDGYREWNKEKFPDLYIFLLTIINSIVSHLIEHHKKFPTDGIEDQEILSASPNPEEVVIQTDNLEKIQKRIYQAVEGDDEIETVILFIGEGLTAPRDIAAQTGFDIARVNSILKRIRRKLRPLYSELFPEKGH